MPVMRFGKVVGVAGLVLLACAASSARAEHPWQAIKVKGDVRYEKRAVEGSKFLEYRATFFMPYEPKVLLDKIWGAVESLRGPSVAQREVIRKGPTEVVMHDYIKTPVVSDRELTLRFEKIEDVAAGGPAIRYKERNDLGPPPAPKRVVLPVVRGGWKLEPAPGGSQVTYDCYSEPGGTVPAWMVRGAQQDQLVDDVERLRARLR